MEIGRNENRLMALVRELEMRTEGLCRAGAGPSERNVAEALMRMTGKGLCVSREECLDAFEQLAEQELAEVYGEAEPETMQGIQGLSM